MTRKLRRALAEQKQHTEQYNQKIPGLLGIPLNGQKRVEVAGRNAYVYVRLRENQSEVIQAYNNKVAVAYNLPVLVERRGGRYEVVDVDSQRYENNWSSFAPFLPRHGNTHSFDIESGGGGDIVWVYPRQIMPALIIPSGSVGAGNVLMSAYTLQNSDGTWKYVGNTGTASLIQHNPSSPTGAVMGLVYLDAPSGNPYLLINSGTVFINSLTGSSQVYPYIPTVSNPATQIPLAAIRLITGTSKIVWDNIYDVRQWIHTTPSGSAGGAGGTTIGLGVMTQDEGVPLGTGVTLNFVGANVEASISGSVVRVFVTGSSGGGDDTYLRLDTSNDPLRGSLVISGTIPGSEPVLSVLNYGTLSSIHIQHTRTSGSTTAQQIQIARTTDTGATFTRPVIDISDIQNAGVIAGSTLENDIDGTVRLKLAPQATGSITPYILDTAVAKNTGSILLQVSEGGNERFRVAQDGTANISTGSYNIANQPHTHTPGTFSQADGPQGFGYNYVINNDGFQPSGTVTISLKTINGTDPSSTDKLYFRIQDTRREVSAPLNITLTSGTNWMNAGSSEHTGQYIDYFVYVIWEAAQSAVRLGVSRIPYAKTMADFSSTSTDEKYIFGNYSAFTSTDRVEVIGRTNAAKSGATGGWLSGTTTISRPIYKTGRLIYAPTWVGWTTPPTALANYIVDYETVYIYGLATTSSTSNSTSTTATLPFTCATITDFLVRNTTSGRNLNTIGSTPAMVTIASADTLIVFYRDFAATTWNASGNKQIFSFEIFYPIN